jgi:hypothetical protein
MEFANKPVQKGCLIPSAWQYTVDQATGDPFYVNAASDCIVYKFDYMFKRLHKKKVKFSKAVTLIPPQSVISVVEEPVPEHAISSHIYSTLPQFKDGTMSQPIQLDEDKLSEALLDLTNIQLLPKKQQKRHTQVFELVKSHGAVLSKEHGETNNDSVDSPNLLEH